LLLSISLALNSACAPELLPVGEFEFQLNDDPASLMKELEATRDQFLAAMEQQGVTPAYRPSVKFWQRGGGTLSSLNDKVVTVVRWSDLTPEVRSLMTKWMGTEKQAKELVAGGFDWFLFVHELGHLVQESRATVFDAWEREFHANEVAVAFRRSQPDAAAKMRRLEQLLQYATPRMTTRSRASGRADLKPNMLRQLTEEEYGFLQFSQIIDILQGSEVNPTLRFAINERTKDGYDCKTVAANFSKSCPNVPDPQLRCAETLGLLSFFLHRECRDLSNSFF
jgi:hypothetical protein